MRKIVLIGFMGSGKTTIGRMLARKLECPLIDTDKMIEEQEGMTISELFAEKGEEYFRACETRLLQQLAETSDAAVIATGGGMAVRTQNHPLLKKLGLVVYLKVSKEAVLLRLAGDQSRPLLVGEDPEGTVQRLLKERGGRYLEASDFEIDTEAASIAAMADRIIEECGGE